MLTLLDSLADGLLAFVLDTYTDGAPSTQFLALAQTKLQRSPAADTVVEPSPWGMTGLLGMGAVGAGVSAAGLGVAFLAGATSESGPALPLLVAGSGVALLGAGLVFIDGGAP